MILHFSLGNLFMLFYFLLTTRYLQIRQRFKSAQLAALNHKLTQSRHRSSMMHLLLLQFNSLTSAITTNIYREIRVHNHFWAKYLTVYFVVYIMETCYMAYAFLFIHTRNGFIRWFFAYFAWQFAAILLLVTYECSVIVYCNCRMQRQQQRFCRQYQAIGNCSNRLRVIDLLKFDSLAANQRSVARLTFTLSNNYRINSQMFELILSYISLLFMMILRRN